ncbi:ABC transporter substrate-binding protein [Roseateles toxinivorans]|uniref:Peptide/nickel transport system substrate-binding protein n=1 Tax=Roseateles toxinivorans TaxID=270368 RepID=A0A4R6QDW9_9BURK|nr:ABC transporter substrate-binding protein [Roseateles toxinivorans]TDP60407.1 peptide/nickel transport system substrate-binding protein [Roseateles toxinivorans]
MRRSAPAVVRAVGLALALALALTACDVSDIPRDPQRVTMAVGRDITSLDPAATFVSANQLAMNLAYEKLVVAEVADGRPTGRMLGQLAERWETSADGLQWTFFLRPGHRFDDGSEVTAEAVKFSFERTLKLKAPPAQFLFFLRSVGAPAPHEVRFTLRTPVPFFLQVLAVPTASIVNPKVMAQAHGSDLGSRWLATHTAGSGPYRVARFEKGQQVMLELNPHADRQPEYFKEVSFLIVKDDATRAIQLAKGAIDIVDPVSGTVDDWMAAQPGVQVVTGLSPTVSFLHLNNERPLLRDVRVRRAISLAIDRELIGKALYSGRTSLLRGVLPAGVPGHDASLPLPRYDPQAARALLREAGVAPGTPLRFTVVGDGSGASPLALAISSQLEAVGLKVVIERISVAARTKIMKGDFDITTQSINLDFPDPSIIFNFVYNSAMIGGANFPRYRNAVVDKLITQADRSLDPTERVDLYQQAQRIVLDEMPTVVLFQLDWQRAARSDIAGVNYNFSQPTFYNFDTMRRAEAR